MRALILIDTIRQLADSPVALQGASPVYTGQPERQEFGVSRVSSPSPRQGLPEHRLSLESL